tara:strand:+ start:1291 stop:3381 length:2091 start_codon:yes stop_codon:yes gene_type:complete
MIFTHFDSIVKNVSSLRNMVRSTFLSARDNPKAYEKDWEELVVELRELLKDPQLKQEFPNIDDSVLFADESLGVSTGKAGELYGFFNNDSSPVTLVKQDRPEKFIEPNKPMYRIFEIDDMKEIKGLTSDYIVQEKYDGLRIQIHKFDNKVKIYTFNAQDITDKMPKCVKILEDRVFPNCILDAEAVMYNEDKPLVRADTLAHINKKITEEADIRAHVFDIMYFEDKSIVGDKLEERIMILMKNFSANADECVLFPNKSNTREADSLAEIEEYSRDIMNNPASEGVVIKDAKSSYVIGKKKNPKWIKWKKFVDLDVIVLDKTENKNGTFGYTMGIGPVEEDSVKAVEMEGDFYMNVGKTTNTKESVEVGTIIRVTADEIMGNPKKGFSLFNTKFHEIPEVKLPDKLITLEFLTTGAKKSLGDYTIEALTKSYEITDGIHGSAKLHTDVDLEGFIFHGFKDQNLMSKNALVDIDFWKQELKEAYGKDNGRFFVFVKQLLIEYGTLSSNDIFIRATKHDPKMINRLFGNTEKSENKMKERLMKAGDNYGIVYSSGKFSHDDDVLVKAETQKAEFELWVAKNGYLHFVIIYKGKQMCWEIQVKGEKEIYDFLGEAGKYPCKAIKIIDKETLLERGSMIMGAQRKGYHEYILNGKETKTKLHCRYLPVKDKEMWLAWTGYETKPAPKSSDAGLFNIYEDDS